MSINETLLNLDYQELDVRLEKLFPMLDRKALQTKFEHAKQQDAHMTVFAVCRHLGKDDNAGYRALLLQHGFNYEFFKTFSCQVNQFTPVLGAVMTILGINTSYLEGCRVRNSIVEGKVEQVNPDEEPNPENRTKFCRIGRIPDCCLEITINGTQFYLSNKYLQFRDKESALLTPTCYRPNIGLFTHPLSFAKSGIYLQQFVPRINPGKIDFGRRVVWMKQKLPAQGEDPEPLEFFMTYKRMRLS